MIAYIKVWLADDKDNSWTKDFHCHFVPRVGEYILPSPFGDELKVEKVVHMMDHAGAVHVFIENIGEVDDEWNTLLENDGWNLC